MTRLREAVREYLNMRRSLGFQLQETGRLLPAFVKFMEEHRSSYITTRSPGPSNHRACSPRNGRIA